MQDYAYLRPSTRMIKASSTAVQRVPNGERQFFGLRDGQLSSEEEEALKNLKDYYKRKYPNREIDDELLLRYFYLGNRHIIGSVEKFKYYDEWWAMPSIPKQK